MSGPPEIVVCAGPDSLHERAARRFVQAARTAIGARGRFAVALSGGSTPRPLFERLADPGVAGAVEWDAVHVFWCDERCVPPDDERSNYGMAKRLLLDRVPVSGTRVHRIRCEDVEPAEAAERYEKELRETLSVTPAETPHLDFALLGLGSDGHTASIFPGSSAAAETTRLALAVPASEPGMADPVVDRVTLAPPALDAAREVVFLVAGSGKAPAVAATLEGPRDPARWPAQAIDPVDGDVAWLLDSGAAAGLSGFVEAVEEAT